MGLNQSLRKNLDLYANVVKVRSLPGVKSRHTNIDTVIIRLERFLVWLTLLYCIYSKRADRGRVFCYRARVSEGGGGVPQGGHRGEVLQNCQVCIRLRHQE